MLQNCKNLWKSCFLSNSVCLHIRIYNSCLLFVYKALSSLPPCSFHHIQSSRLLYFVFIQSTCLLSLFSCVLLALHLNIIISNPLPSKFQRLITLRISANHSTQEANYTARLSVVKRRRRQLFFLLNPVSVLVMVI